MKYDPDTYTGGTSNNIVNLDYGLPNGDCSIEWESNITSSNNMNNIVRIGYDGTNFVWVGLTGTQTYRLQVYENATYKQQLQSSNVQPLNTWTELSATVENDKVKFKDLTQTYSQSFSIEKLLTIILQRSSIRNIKIKQL